MRSFDDVLPVLKTLGRALEKYARIDKMPFDFGVGDPLFPAEIHMVSTVVTQGPFSVTELAQELGTTKGAVSQLTGRLLKKGLFTKEKDRHNGARVIISATELGRVAHSRHMEFHQKHDAQFMAFLQNLDDSSYQVVCSLSEEMDGWMGNYLK
ncbi:MarR family transcriptional regulator [Pseudodesulfovibrio sediminis]|uniref:MarR family transcriptional regulator n=1 Tax=Pseudodesulfovibrio sediminis TaxID=2810563 RepID=A0ABN6ES48_9BACT|nr:MarR family transcriptional regulator [Pseudodesulfovibrio sediminis]BCS87959.1 MarR family transcriptional regulator [Pseudodesulfovibrio sediminis]